MDKQQLPQEWQEQIIQESKAYAIDGSSNNLYYIEGAVTWSKRAYEAEKYTEQERAQRVHLEKENDILTDNYATLKAQADKMAEAYKEFQDEVTLAYGALIGGMKKDTTFALNTILQANVKLNKALADYQGKKEGGRE